MTADAEMVQDDLRARLIVQRDRIHRACVHAPGFVTLNASVGSVTGLFVKHVDTNQTLRWLEGSGLHPRACKFALHAAGTFVGDNS